MSDEKQETMADILADIRERAENAMRNGERLVHNEAVAMLLRSVADRLEAAWKRDEEHAVEHATRHAEAVARDNCRDCVHNPNGKNYEGGNPTAMREALERFMGWYNITSIRTASLRTIAEAALAALAAPPRNCDVGTAEEQSVRMSEFCREQYEKTDGIVLCSGCRFHNMEGLDCQFAWAQMPYKAERKGESNESK